MRTHFRGLVLLAFPVALAASLLAGCGGGGSDSGSLTPGPGGQIGSTASATNNGVSATASVNSNQIVLSAHVDRSVAQVWATATGVAGQVRFTGSARDWTASTQVSVPANSVVDIQVYAQDTVGNILGPAIMRVQTGEFGTQSAVTGKVISGADSQPVSGATVTVGNQATSTDSTGKFTITGLVAGLTLQGSVTKSGFNSASFSVTVTSGVVSAGTISLSATPDLPPPAPVFP